jgi:putative transposase
MCRVLGVSSSGYYTGHNRPPSPRAIANEKLAEQMREVHQDSRGTYGSPRMHQELLARGVKAGRHRVARVMRSEGLRGVCRRRGWRTTVRDERARPAPDLVKRDFSATDPDRLWVADITYVPTWAGFLFLAVVLDVFSRRIVGWSMATHMRTELVLDALEMAYRQRRPRGVIFHSDQGSQYTSVAFGGRCSVYGIRPSRGSVGDCYDNAMAESLFATLECELLDRVKLPDPATAKREVFSYIEGWYNPHRLHSAIGYLSPVEFERRHGSRDRGAAPPDIEAAQSSVYFPAHEPDPVTLPERL